MPQRESGAEGLALNSIKMKSHKSLFSSWLGTQRGHLQITILVSRREGIEGRVTGQGQRLDLVFVGVRPLWFYGAGRESDRFRLPIHILSNLAVRI